jgi:hypothetical protein
MIRIISGWTGYGGSTIALIEHCKLFNKKGLICTFYGNESWHIARLPRRQGALIGSFNSSSDDYLIYHYWELPKDKRPPCKKAILYCHEKGLFDLRQRDISGYDEVIFCSESQKAWHNWPGKVVPNPMSYVRGKHKPPGENIAGIIGHIIMRKKPHVAIQQALNDGRSKVLLYGTKDNAYFEEYIRPLLCDRVVYEGLADPSRMIEMYNTVDVVYHAGEDESACLVQGECKMLGIPFIGSEKLTDYPIVSNDEVFEKWLDILKI